MIVLYIAVITLQKSPWIIVTYYRHKFLTCPLPAISFSLCSNIKPKNSVKFEIANSFLCNLLIIIKVLRCNSLGHSLFHTSLSYYISLTAFVVAENWVMRNIGQNIPCPEVFAFSYRVLKLCSQIYMIVNTSWKRVWGNVQPDMAPFLWEPSWLSRGSC